MYRNHRVSKDIFLLTLQLSLPYFFCLLNLEKQYLLIIKNLSFFLPLDWGVISENLKNLYIWNWNISAWMFESQSNIH